MQTIGAYVIAKNESAMVEDCLRSLKGFDDIVFIDTGSTDDTVAKAKKYPIRFFDDFKWCDDFSKARNYALSKCATEWIFRLDCDEMLEIGGIKKIRELIEKTKHAVVNVTISYPPGSHLEPRLFKQDPDNYYIGASHEYLKHPGETTSDIRIFARSSPSHKRNPSLAMTILEKEVNRDPNLIREKFYYARELYYHKNYALAIIWFDRYIAVSNWIYEKAEAHYFKALCLWNLSEGQKAREELAQAILINPNMKKALRLMADMNYPKQASAWLKFEAVATNDDVIFR